jgi:glycosyltransferase involved in cell wall biosynthesis
MAVKAEHELLASRGHSVASYFVSNDGITGSLDALMAGAASIYSMQARHEVQQAIEAHRPDIVHIHNFFPLLSPSVYDACREMGVPTVQTLHNFRLACPNGLFLREGRPCEDCLGRTVPWPGILHGCYRGSAMQTSAVAAMLAFHKMRGTWRDRVNAFVAVTAFQRDRLIKAGLPAERVHIKPNFAFDPGESPERPSGGPMLYVGRLSEEKGCEPLIDAYIEGGLRVPLHIVGDGPLRATLEEKVAAAGLGGIIQFLGKKTRPQVLDEMRLARLLVVPSTCYEGFPLTIAEAFAVGLPVLASRTGGIPEIVLEGQTGWLVQPGDAIGLANAVSEIWPDEIETHRRGLLAREAYELHFSPTVNHARLMEIYDLAQRP